ncbi:MAG: hypothetical protein WCO57_09150 [Verrucomicrobiota bacterium]
MQRWIVAAGFLLGLMVVGGAFAHRAYQQNRSTQVWLPMPINPDQSAERLDMTVKLLKQKLSEHALLVRVSKDVSLAKKMKLASDEEAANALEKRLFVELGKADSPVGKIPSLNIGLNCKVKELTTMGEVVNRLRKDVFSILGIPEPRKQAF